MQSHLEDSSCEKLLKSTLEELSANCNRYVSISKSSVTGPGVGKTKLDKERTKLCQREVESIGILSRNLKALVTKSSFKERLKTAHSYLQKLKFLVEDVSIVFLERCRDRVCALRNCFVLLTAARLSAGRVRLGNQLRKTSGVSEDTGSRADLLGRRRGMRPTLRKGADYVPQSKQAQIIFFLHSLMSPKDLSKFWWKYNFQLITSFISISLQSVITCKKYLPRFSYLSQLLMYYFFCDV